MSESLTAIGKGDEVAAHPADRLRFHKLHLAPVETAIANVLVFHTLNDTHWVTC